METRYTVAEIKAWGALEYHRSQHWTDALGRAQARDLPAHCIPRPAIEDLRAAAERWRRVHNSGKRWRGILGMLRQAEAVRQLWERGADLLVSESERRQALLAKRLHWHASPYCTDETCEICSREDDDT